MQKKKDNSSFNIKLIIQGRIPSKKNSRMLFARGGKLMNIPSKAYAEWHKDAMGQLLTYTSGTIQNVKKVTLALYAPDKRASDLTNKAESIMDLLVDKGVLEDDNWWIVSNIELIFMGVDKEYPRCEVCIIQKETPQ